MNHAIHPDVQYHPDAVFKVFRDGTKVATLTRDQLLDALKRHDGQDYAPTAPVIVPTVEDAARDLIQGTEASDKEQEHDEPNLPFTVTLSYPPFGPATLTVQVLAKHKWDAIEKGEKAAMNRANHPMDQKKLRIVSVVEGHLNNSFAR